MVVRESVGGEPSEYVPVQISTALLPWLIR